MSLAQSSEPGTPTPPSLLRALGPGMAMAVVVGNVIGSGIYFKPGGIAKDAGDFGVILTAWVVGGLICLMGSLCIAELGAMLPHAGGLYVYLREAYGRPVAFLYGWTDFLFSRPASIGALTVVFVETLFRLGKGRPGTASELALEAAIIVAMAWINILGVIWGGRVQGATTIAKAGFLAGVAVLPFAVAWFGHTSLVPENLATTVTPEKPTLSTQFAAALLGILWAYNGWESLGSVAEEIREPQKNIPRALFGGLGILIVLYVSANVAYHLSMPMQQIADSGEHAAEKMCEKLLGPIGRHADGRRPSLEHVQRDQQQHAVRAAGLVRDGARRRFLPQPGLDSLVVPHAGLCHRRAGRHVDRPGRGLVDPGARVPLVQIDDRLRHLVELRRVRVEHLLHAGRRRRASCCGARDRTCRGPIGRWPIRTSRFSMRPFMFGFCGRCIKGTGCSRTSDWV